MSVIPQGLHQVHCVAECSVTMFNSGGGSTTQQNRLETAHQRQWQADVGGPGESTCPTGNRMKKNPYKANTLKYVTENTNMKLQSLTAKKSRMRQKRTKFPL